MVRICEKSQPKKEGKKLEEIFEESAPFAHWNVAGDRAQYMGGVYHQENGIKKKGEWRA